MPGEYGEPIFWYRDEALKGTVFGGGFPIQDSRGTVIAVCAGETIAQRMQDTYNALDGIPNSELAEFVKRAKEDRRKCELAKECFLNMTTHFKQRIELCDEHSMASDRELYKTALQMIEGHIEWFRVNARELGLEVPKDE